MNTRIVPVDLDQPLTVEYRIVVHTPVGGATFLDLPRAACAAHGEVAWRVTLSDSERKALREALRGEGES